MHHVYAVERVVKDLGVSEEFIHELSLGLEPEDSVIWVYGGSDGDGILAFTDEGFKEVQLLLDEYRRGPRSKA